MTQLIYYNYLMRSFIRLNENLRSAVNFVKTGMKVKLMAWAGYLGRKWLHHKSFIGSKEIVRKRHFANL